jgi:hypothetical protein
MRIPALHLALVVGLVGRVSGADAPNGNARSDDWPARYEALAIEATVVDAESNAPLEGVIVDAHWHLDAGIDASPPGELMILETVTDAQGRFQFPAWGPKAIPSPRAQMACLAPRLVLFKPGYRYGVFQNDCHQVRRRPLLKSDWDGKNTPLRRFEGSPREYSEHLLGLDGAIEFFAFYAEAYDQPSWPGCEWKSIPKMLAALLAQQAVFARVPGIGMASLPTPDILEERANPKRCGSLKAFLKKSGL